LRLRFTDRPCFVTVVTLKLVALVAVPPGVVTVILPVVAPAGTVAVTDVAVLVVNVAVTPLNLTAVTPVRLVPVIVTFVPTGPLVGVKDVMVAPATTVKLVALFAGPPPEVVTWIGPVVAPTGTVAVIWVAELTTYVVAAVVLNITEFVHPKFVPVMTTLAPADPVVGANEVIVGTPAAAGMKFAVLAVSAAGVSTVIGPAVAPAGTVAVTWPSVTKTSPKEDVPLNNTSDIPVKPAPLIVTTVPASPHVGVNDVMVDADAGSAVTSTPTTPRTSASAVARAETFLFWNLKEGSPLLASRK
jgi:hypothetical protein